MRLRLWEEGEALLFEVSDDGAGFDQSAHDRSDIGFINMGDRLGAIGGSLRVQSQPGVGTRVSGRLPLG